MAHEALDSPDPELEQAFGHVYDDLRRPRREVSSFGDWLAVLHEAHRESLSELLVRGEPVPPQRLHQIRVVLRKLLLGDESDRLDGPTEQYGEAAERLIRTGDGVEVVLMGHTHLPHRLISTRGDTSIPAPGSTESACPPRALADGADRELQEFLQDLRHDRRPDCPPTYADLRIGDEGKVEEAKLETLRL